jgi:hypothetical protein
MISLVLLPLLAAARVFLTLRFLSLRGEDWQSPHALGYLVGGVVALPAVALAVASLWRANRTRPRLMLVANVAMFVSVLAAAGQLAGAKPLPAPPPPTAAGAYSDPDERIFVRDAWLADCMRSCRRDAPGRLKSLSSTDRERHCTISCECGLAHMTDPGPEKGQVKAPSARWKAETEDQHRQGVMDCLKRASDEIAASHPG